MALDHLEENSAEESAERSMPVKRSVERMLLGLAVVAVVVGAVGQSETWGGKIYCTDTGSSKIQRANLDGTSVEDLIFTHSSGPMDGGGQRYAIAIATTR
jgi:ferric-dicitrate binding protein FerR (iron transport regulator)